MAAPPPHHADLWVFSYGSLMWRPGFAFDERCRATLAGFSRRFCMNSFHYRGTPDSPGLVLALDRDPGSRCVGLAYRVGRDAADRAVSYLREREMVSVSGYVETLVPVELERGDSRQWVDALTYVINRGHRGYAGEMELVAQAERIAGCAGASGGNAEYLESTVARLRELGVVEPELEALEGMVKRLRGVNVS